jgi:iron(III) transport system substrate-binding protein
LNQRIACAAAALCAALAFAADINPARLEGPERARLVAEGAKREGAVTLYSSVADKDLRRLVAEFERRYAIKVSVYRAGKDKVLSRVITEARGGRNEVDVIHNPSPEMEVLHREKLLQPVVSPLHATLIPEAVAPHREWAGPRVYLFVQAYNTTKVKPEEVPRSWRDLADPRWKGRLAIEEKEVEWFHALMQAMGEEQGLALFRQIVATNGLSVRRGNALITNMVAAGEVPFALTLYSYLPDQARRAGAPVQWIALPPTVAATDAVGISARPAHPHAAVLLYDFLLGDGQKLLGELHHVVSNKRIAPELKRLDVRFIDPGALIGDERWTKIYENTIHGK